MGQPWNVGHKKAAVKFISPNGIKWLLSGKQKNIEEYLGGALRSETKRKESK